MPHTRACFVALALAFLSSLMSPPRARAADEVFRVGVFRVDVSPPLGSPVAYAPARKIEDPLSARGIVLVGAGQPIVLCAVDAIGIGNEGFDQWREDRKSTRLNSSHSQISYAVFCLKKKTKLAH